MECAPARTWSVGVTTIGVENRPAGFAAGPPTLGRRLVARDWLCRTQACSLDGRFETQPATASTAIWFAQNEIPGGLRELR